MESRVASAFDEDSLRYEGWRVAAASGIGVFLASVFIYTFAIFLKPLSEEFSWSREAVSRAYGITAMMAALCFAPYGYLYDRLGPKRLVLPCLLLLGCAFASLSLLTPHLWHLYAIFAALGIAGAGLSPVAYARAISSWFERRRGTALAVAISGGSIGGVVHPAAAHALMSIAGWRAACLALGGLVIALGLPTVARLIRERPSDGTATAGDGVGGAGMSVGQGLRSRVFWLVVLVLFCASTAMNGTIVHIFALLTDRGVSANHAALTVSVMAGASFVGRLLTGWLIDRFFAARVAFALLVTAALGTFLLAGAHSFSAGVLAAVLIGFGVGGEFNVTPFLLSRYFGLRSFSTLYGMTYIAAAAAGAIGPVLMGRIFDATGSYERFLVGLSAAMLGAATITFVMPRYQSPMAAHASAAVPV